MAEASSEVFAADDPVAAAALETGIGRNVEVLQALIAHIPTQAGAAISRAVERAIARSANAIDRVHEVEKPTPTLGGGGQDGNTDGGQNGGGSAGNGGSGVGPDATGKPTKTPAPKPAATPRPTTERPEATPRPTRTPKPTGNPVQGGPPAQGGDPDDSQD